MKQLYQNLTGKKLLFRTKMYALLQAIKYLLTLIAVTAFFWSASWIGFTDSGTPKTGSPW